MLARRVGGRVRYAVVGGGWISQADFMPGVAQTGNSELVALVTGDPEKGRALGERYGLRHVWSYDEYDRMLESEDVDAVYIALPNGKHRDYTVPALAAGLHVLLEKPMAVSEEECLAIEAAAAASGARLMIAYRLHFDPATLEALRVVRSGEIGDPRLFTSTFSQRVEAANHRAQNGFWAGPVADMGTYPINAARNLFGAEPTEVTATGARDPAGPFGFHDTVAVAMRFPGDRLAQFTVSYGASGTGEYRVVGTEGSLSLEPGFAIASPMTLRVRRGEAKREQVFPATDQFGGETQYFSDCVLSGRDPEPDGEEGRLDVRVIAAVERALASGQPQQLPSADRSRRPTPDQERKLPPIDHPEFVNAAEPGG